MKVSKLPKEKNMGFLKTQETGLKMADILSEARVLEATFFNVTLDTAVLRFLKSAAEGFGE